MLVTLITWIVVLGALCAMAMHRLAAKWWLPLVAALLALLMLLQLISSTATLVGWSMLLLLALFIYVTPLRRRLFTAPLLRWFRRQQPEITAQEKSVLQAGGMWWEEQLFAGRPNWSLLHKLDSPCLTSQEQAFIQNQVTTLCEMLDDWRVAHEWHDLPPEVWSYIKQERFWGLTIDKAYGGLGFSAYAHSTIVAKIASRCPTAAFTVMVPNSLGPAEFLHHFGTQHQKNYYLPRLAQGQEIPCFALTSDTAGSDATSISDSGVVCRGQWHGKDVIGVRLNFSKRYITLGPIATLIGLAFKMIDPDGLLGDKKDLGITLALVPSDTAGVQQGKRHWPQNLSFYNGPLAGQDVFIPLDMIIGGENGIGRGWHMMLECLSLGRGISLPSLSAATNKLCLRMSADYAIIRQQFNRSIGQFEGIQNILARLAGFTLMSEAMRRFLALAVDKKARPSVASAIAKFHMTALSRQAVNESIDVHGGRGVQIGPGNYLEAFYNAAPVMTTVEGANVLTRNLIIFGQGVMRCHPFLQREIEAAFDSDEQQSLQRFDALLLEHVGFFMHQLGSSLLAGVSGGRWLPNQGSDEMRYYYQQITRMSHALLMMTDLVLAIVGKDFKMKESLSARMGDVVSYLFIASSVLKYFKDMSYHAELKPCVEWSLQYCLYQAQLAVVDITDNFPWRWLGKVMRRIVFPLGLAYAYPGDALSHALAQSVQYNDSVRDMLTLFCYVGKDKSDLTGIMEVARQSLLQSKPLQDKLRQAMRNQQISPQSNWQEAIHAAKQAGVISEIESEQLLHIEKLVLQACAVDDFNKEFKHE